MKTFFIWLTLQCVFARVLFGISVELWRSLHLVGSDSVAYFILPAVVICLTETIVSGVILFDLIMVPMKHAQNIEITEIRLKNPNARW